MIGKGIILLLDTKYTNYYLKIKYIQLIGKIYKQNRGNIMT